MAAAVAAPYVINAFTSKPKRPKYQQQEVDLPDRSQYFNELMNMGFDPQKENYRASADVASEQVNRALARQGLAGSSVGGQVQAAALSKLAQDYENERMQRASSALNQLTSYDLQQAGLNQGASDAAYNRALEEYKIKMGGISSGIQGISAGIGTAANIYATDSANERARRNPYSRPEAPSYTYPQASYGNPQTQYNLGGDFNY